MDIAVINNPKIIPRNDPAEASSADETATILVIICGVVPRVRSNPISRRCDSENKSAVYLDR